jgi:hypothetical protein
MVNARETSGLARAAAERLRKFWHDVDRIAGSSRDAALVMVAIAGHCGIRPPRWRRRGKPAK